jgi:hypothetical protein
MKSSASIKGSVVSEWLKSSEGDIVLNNKRAKVLIGMSEPIPDDEGIITINDEPEPAFSTLDVLGSNGRSIDRVKRS